VARNAPTRTRRPAIRAYPFLSQTMALPASKLGLPAFPTGTPQGDHRATRPTCDSERRVLADAIGAVTAAREATHLQTDE